MLQIASGRLFRPVELHETLHTAVLYSNYRIYGPDSWPIPIGKLLPSTTIGDISSMTAQIVERQEAVGLDGQPSVFVATTGEDLISDLAAVISFVADVTCSPDADLVRRLISGRWPAPGGVTPQKYVPRLFDQQVIARPHDAERLSSFLQKLISLDRTRFVAAMRAIRRFVLGTHRIADEISLAYSLFVMSIESLASWCEPQSETWQDYDSQKRARIDQALARASTGTRAKVRSAIMENEHLALSRRYREFALRSVKPSFFRQEAVGAIRPLPRSDLAFALSEAYKIRSKYVHTLQEIPANLRFAHDHSESVWLDGRDILSFAGLIRLVRHLILGFVEDAQAGVPGEGEYRRDLPGIITAPMAAQYWIWRPNGFNSRSAPKRLEGLLEQLGAILTRAPDAVLTDLSGLMELIEKQLRGLASASSRRPLLALYYLFHKFAPDTHHRPQWFDKIVAYETDLGPPSMESLLVCLAEGRQPPWTLPEVEAVWTAYLEQRDRRNGFRMGRLFEAGVLLTLAEMSRQTNNVTEAKTYVGSAVEAFPGSAALREFEQRWDGSQSIQWIEVISPEAGAERQKATATSASAQPAQP